MSQGILCLGEQVMKFAEVVKFAYWNNNCESKVKLVSESEAGPHLLVGTPCTYEDTVSSRSAVHTPFVKSITTTAKIGPREMHTSYTGDRHSFSLQARTIFHVTLALRTSSKPLIRNSKTQHCILNICFYFPRLGIRFQSLFQR